MKPIIILIACVYLILLSLGRPCYADEVTFSCGPNAVFVMLRLNHVKVDPEDLFSLPLVRAKSPVLSMQDLVELTDHYGMSTIPVAASLSDLTRLQVPFIAHLRDPHGEGHFVVLWGNGSEELNFVDYPRRGSTSTKALEQVYTGKSLVPKASIGILSKLKPLPKPPAATEVTPRQSVSKAAELTWASGQEVKLNSVEASPKPVLVKFTIRSSGMDALRCYEVRTSCGCMKAELSKAILAPGEEGIVTVQVDIKDAGAFKEQILIKTNVPQQMWQRATIEGNVLSSLNVQSVPFEARFDSAPPNVELHQRIVLNNFVRNQTDKPFVIKQLRIEKLSNCISAKVIKDWHTLDRALSPDTRQCEIDICVKHNFEPNLYDGELVVCGADGKDLRVPIIVNVRPVVYAEPSICYVDLRNRALPGKTILFKSDSDAPVNITSVSTTDARISVSIKTGKLTADTSGNAIEVAPDRFQEKRLHTIIQIHGTCGTVPWDYDLPVVIVR